MTTTGGGALTLAVAFLALAVHASPANAGTLQQVPANHVCMVNHTHFPVPQIPVPVPVRRTSAAAKCVGVA